MATWTTEADCFPEDGAGEREWDEILYQREQPDWDNVREYEFERGVNG